MNLMQFAAMEHLYKTSREGDRACYFVQLIKGVQYLHFNGIAHMDIKGDNLLVSANGSLKITDFGISLSFLGTHPILEWHGTSLGKKRTVPKRFMGVSTTAQCWPPEVSNARGL